MSLVNLLVVEDGEALAKEIEEFALQLREHDPEVTIDVARCAGSALEKLLPNFYHAALVDLNLQQNTDDKSGLEVVRNLREKRPTCKRFLYTQMPWVAPTETQPEFLQTLLDTVCPWAVSSRSESLETSIHGIIPKDREDYRLFIPRFISAFRKNRVRVDGCREVVEELRAASYSTSATWITEAEVEYVVSQLFGSSFGADQTTYAEGMKSVQLRLHRGEGKSGSVVAFARPEYHGGHGVHLIIKIGDKDQSRKEVEGYDRYVRFQVSQNRRVEMLASSFGDLIGAVMYTFAGSHPGTAESLSKLLEPETVDVQLADRARERALAAIPVLFDPKKKEWYAREVRPAERLKGFFRNAYKVEYSRIEGSLRKTRAFLERQGVRVVPEDEIIGGMLRPVWKVGDVILPLPAERLTGAGRFGLDVHYHACLVHGDMNASNAFVSLPERPLSEHLTEDTPTVTWIDFGETRIGPRSLDFAAIQSSIRLGVGSIPGDSGIGIVVCGSVELARELKALSLEEQLLMACADKQTLGCESRYWVRADHEVWKVLMNNFDQSQDPTMSFPSISVEEHATVCYMWAARVLKASWPTALQCLRMLVWMSALEAKLPTA